MQPYQVVQKISLALGLEKNRVACAVKQKDYACYRYIRLMFPAHAHKTASQIVTLINKAVCKEAASGNVSFSVTPYVLSRQKSSKYWYRIVLDLCRWSQIVRKKKLPLHHIALLQTVTAHSSAQKDQEIAVVIVTSYYDPKKKGVVGAHNQDRTNAVVKLIEKYENELRSLIRHALPSHHLIGTTVPTRDEALERKEKDLWVEPPVCDFEAPPVAVSIMV